MTFEKTSRPFASDTPDADAESKARENDRQPEGRKILDWLHGEQDPQLDREMARYLFGDSQTGEAKAKRRSSGGGSQC